MFGIFKRKKSSPIDAIFNSLDARSVTVMGGAAKILVIQLMPCRSQTSYIANMHSKFVRGYLFGFLDAAAQKAGLPFHPESQAILRIIAGHSFVFTDSDVDAVQYVKDSAALQDDPTYIAGHTRGVDDAMGCYDLDPRKPVGLTEHFLRHV